MCNSDKALNLEVISCTKGFTIESSINSSCVLKKWVNLLNFQNKSKANKSIETSGCKGKLPKPEKELVYFLLMKPRLTHSSEEVTHPE